MRLLTKYGANPYSNTTFKRSLIWFALEHNDSKLLIEVLEWKETTLDFNEIDSQNRNMFHCIA